MKCPAASMDDQDLLMVRQKSIHIRFPSDVLIISGFGAIIIKIEDALLSKIIGTKIPSFNFEFRLF